VGARFMGVMGGKVTQPVQRGGALVSAEWRGPRASTHSPTVPWASLTCQAFGHHAGVVLRRERRRLSQRRWEMKSHPRPTLLRNASITVSILFPLLCLAN